MRNSLLFIVSREDWSLHRKGYQDQLRHQEKVKEAIQKQLPDLVSEETVILSDGQDMVKVPIRSLDEYRFRFNDEKRNPIGQGDGQSKVGDVIARDGNETAVPGEGTEVGSQPGDDYYETKVSVEEIEEMLFAEMALPNLEKKEQQQIMVTDIEFNDIRKKGLMGNVDKKRTILAAMKRSAMDGKIKLNTISNDDLRFKTWSEQTKPESTALVIAMMDTSGSMGMFEKYMARSYFFWMTRFLRTKYEKVEIIFIAHHTEAQEVSEEHFFSKGESGGTICSSAYKMALEIIDSRYPPSAFNIYPVHFSDGDNLTSDNERCVRLVKQLMARSNMFGYGEVNQYNRHSTLMSAYRHIEDEKFKHCVIREKNEVYKALTTFFKKEQPKA